MRLGLAIAFLCLSPALAAQNTPAPKLFKEGQKAERAGDFVRAYLLYAEAAALEPGNTTYWARSQALRTRAALLAKPKPRPVPATAAEAPPAAPERPAATEGPVTEAELAEARRAQPPMELSAAAGARDLDLRGDSKALFTAVGRAYGLDAFFDFDYKPGPATRFRLEGADYRQALHALEAATKSFLVPLSERSFLVAEDTPQKRQDLEPTVSVVVAIPQTVSAQETQELARTVQQALDLRRFAVDPQRGIVLIRDRVSKVRPAQQVFTQLLYHRPQVVIEVEFIEIQAAGSTSYGFSPQTQFPVVNFGKLWRSSPSIPSGFTRFAVFGGGKTFLGLGMTDAELFARTSRSSARSLLRAEVRSVDGQPATLNVGDKYPILTGRIYAGSQGETSGFTLPPSFNFEDLGLALKVTPKVHGTEEVSLDVEAEFKVLAGQSFNDIPVVSNRRLQSKVRLRNGEWAVVAGLMNAEEARSISGLAGLAQLPGLGPLFRRNTKDTNSSEVLLLLKPRLLALPPGEAATHGLLVGSESRPLTSL